MAQKVLVAPLSWGLGHATRCIPAIRHLLKKGDVVHIASDGAALEYLRSSFPHLVFHELPLLRITYTNRLPLYLKFPEIAFRLMVQLWRDRRAIRQLQKKEHFDIVISDSRLGLRCEDAKCYLMTHQMRVVFGKKEGLVERLSARIVRRMAAKFDACLIPDYDNASNLTGKISLPAKGIKHLYINPQSRFPIASAEFPLPSFDLLVILSGPEPQRSKLERLVIALSVNSRKQIMLVRGTQRPSALVQLGNFRFIDFASDAMLQALILKSALVVARAGYSTIMDLNALGKGAVLVPTPHQPEQEYLASWLDGKRGFTRAEQSIEGLKKWF